MIYYAKAFGLSILPTILCSTDSKYLYFLFAGEIIQGFQFFSDSNTFYLGPCVVFVAYCGSGGFTGDGCSVSSGQQAAGEIQDAGRDR